MHKGACCLALALKVLAADEAAVDVKGADRDGALLMEIKVQHMPLYLAKVRAVFVLDLLLVCRVGLDLTAFGIAAEESR